MKFDNYMGKFASSGDVQTAVDNGDLVKPYVALVEDGNYIDWNTKYFDPKDHYLTFKILTDGVIYFRRYGGYSDVQHRTVQYRKNNDEWKFMTSRGDNLNVNSGDIIEFKGKNNTYASDYNIYTYFDIQCCLKMYGNIMSLIDGNNFATMDTLQSAYTFINLFQNCTGLTDASELVLPATTLANECYREMFKGCTSLTSAPELPATNLKTSCYSKMFADCTSLTKAPSILPTTTLPSGGCYYFMFYNCTSLTTAPELPATTLKDYCYESMFQGCTSLNYIKCLATEKTTSNTRNWVSGVASTGTFVKAAGVNWPTGTSGIPTGWTVQEV